MAPRAGTVLYQVRVLLVPTHQVLPQQFYYHREIKLAEKQLVLKENVQAHPHSLGSALGARPGPRLIAGITLKRPLTPLVLDSPAWGERGKS